ncbi:MAG: S41 family peptidase [Flavobacteriales bacterium]|nr:S41 family peptidase [Flavobacteriales bacterium]
MFRVLAILLIPAILQSQSISEVDIREDLDFLSKNLLKYHPNLDIYSSSKKIVEEIRSTAKTTEIKTSQEAFRFVSGKSSIIRCGHTHFFSQKVSSQKGFFPFKTCLIDNSLYLIHSTPNLDSSLYGQKLLSLNGIDTETILTEMYDCLYRDGFNNQYPKWIINTYFSYFYEQLYGSYGIHKFSLQNLEDSIISKEINGTKQAPAKYLRSILELEKSGIVLRINQTEKTGYLKIKTFDNKLLRRIYKQKFRKCIRKNFKQIKSQELNNLTIDLRDNQGGALQNGAFLLSHLINQPFQIIEKYEKTKKNRRYSVRKVKGPIAGMINPKRNTYKRNLNVLINGGSFSCSGIVSTVLEKNRKVTFIGEETGGSASVLAGGNTKSIVLPNSKFRVEIPTLGFRLASNFNPKDGGIKPNTMIQLSYEDLIRKKDPFSSWIID